jgi:FKBP-type peptidyl-prolyl cis-trans isomerase
MKYTLLALCTCTAVWAQDTIKLDTLEQRASYAIGMDIASNFKRQGLEVDATALAAGLVDAMTGKETKMSEESARTTLTEFQKIMQEKMTTKAAAAAASSKTEGVSFLETNKAAKGVVTTDTGLQYKVLAAGEGDKPTAANTVTVHYTGKLLSGEVFDSSVERGTPATFGLGQVIPGWTEGLQLMAPGAKYEFWIPSALAYGDRGYPPKIAGGSTLNFIVELISFK